MIILTTIFCFILAFIAIVIGFICSFANTCSSRRKSKATMKRFNYAMETAIRNSRGR